HQRAELCPLQNLRHQGSESEHHLGSPRRRWRSELSEYVTGRHDAALITAFKGGGHDPSGPLLRAQPKQAILRHAAAPIALVRQMESSCDPFVTFKACGHGRSRCPCPWLAGNGDCTGRGARESFSHFYLRQLSGSPTRER